MCKSIWAKGQTAYTQGELVKILGKKMVIVKDDDGALTTKVKWNDCLCPVEMEKTAAGVGCKVFEIDSGSFALIPAEWDEDDIDACFGALVGESE